MQNGGQEVSVALQPDGWTLSPLWLHISPPWPTVSYFLENLKTRNKYLQVVQKWVLRRQWTCNLYRRRTLIRCAIAAVCFGSVFPSYWLIPYRNPNLFLSNFQIIHKYVPIFIAITKRCLFCVLHYITFSRLIIAQTLSIRCGSLIIKLDTLLPT